MVLEKPGNLRDAVLVRTHHAVVLHERAEQEIAAAQRQVREILVGEHARCFGDAPHHEAVPSREDLFVAPGAHASLTRVVEDALRAFDGRAKLRERDAVRLRERVWLVGNVEDVAPLEVALRGNAPVRGEERGVFSEQCRELAGIPHVVASFVAFAVRVERREEATVRRRHLACDPANGLARDAFDLVGARGLPEIGAETHEECVVVEHLLEVGHEPLGVHAVARESSAHLIVDPAARHLLEGVRHHREHIFVTGARPLPQREVERHGRRKFRRTVEAAVHGLVSTAQAVSGASEELLAEHAGGAGALGARLVELAHLRGGARDAVLPVPPRIGDAEEHAPEARHAVAFVRREVGARVERLAVGREEHGHRPAAVPRHRLRGLHVDRVDVGTLLAVHLDADEVFIHEGSRRLILERLALHDVAPMAGRVANAQQDRPCFRPRAGERGVTPGIPVHGVMRVLEEIGAGLVL